MKRDVIRLVLKDFQIQKGSALKYLLTGLVFVVVFYLMGGIENQMLFAVVSFILIYRFINTAMYEDEKNNSLRLLVSLPIRRDVIVIARYLSTAILTIVLGVIMWAVLALTGMLSGDESLATVLVITSISLVYIIMISIYLPLGFRLGYLKAVNINRFLFLAIIVVFGAIPMLISKLGGGQTPESALRLGEMLEAADPVLAVTGFAIFTILVYIVSMRISIVLFRKRLLF
jgi:ABC-2 type transport system permease protein